MAVSTSTSLGIKAKTAQSMSGTLVLTGATPVAVANIDITARDIVIFGLNTAGGTPAAYTHAITAGTGFAVTGTAGDTSTLNYVIIRAVA